MTVVVAVERKVVNEWEDIGVGGECVAGLIGMLYNSVMIKLNIC